ncbi:hypothetical protein GCM10009677_57090 [Sphaerisporangium rubeum]|uniref:Tissue inhibitor of metalloproteinase n=1 Tax=Sphaerisporangium rubeum TaxID=321317 RepID=A0A7X0IFQ2_9ACTN|nr:hypothetical protein [Sphaerisporangium rubeum]MBB6474098.1 hypothetical protein [Sphaerisporangium rubeum]
MKSRAVIVILLVTAALAVAPGTACACSCAPLKPAAQMREAAAVFTGTVVTSREIGGGPEGITPPVVFTFQADQVYKGRATATFQVATNRDSAACGVNFETGRRYLVFAASGPSGLLAVDPGVDLTTSLCAGNQQVRPGTGPLRPADGVPAGSPLPADLLTALGTPGRPEDQAASPAAPPSPGETPASPEQSPEPSSLTATPVAGGGPAPAWTFPVIAVAVAMFAAAGWWLVRRRTGRRS